MGYLAYDTLNPRMYILACNVDAVVIQSTQDESKLMLLNNLATSQDSLEPNFTISASNEDFNINKNSNLLSSFQYVNDESIQIIDVNKTKKVIFNESDGIIDSNPGISFSNNNLLIQLNTSNSFNIIQDSNILVSSIFNIENTESRLGIGITNPEYALHVEGSIYSSGTIVASNLTIIGDTVTLDTITSNTEQMIITNMGDGPAIIVSQIGVNPIAEFYDDGTLCMIIDDNGLVGIGVTEPTETLDVSGNAKISGDISSTNLNITGDIYYNGQGIDIKNIAYRWILDSATSNLYYTIANIGIGTSKPSQILHVVGNTIIDGIITTNNNDINAGTGTITASIFDGTASNVANYLSPGNYLLGANYDGSSNITWGVNATSDNTVSTIVSRDSSGNFSAGTITATTFSGTLDGTASNVANFLSPGNYLLGVNYDGSSNITWGVNATYDNTVSTIVSRDSIGNFSAGTITANLTGNASTASISDKVSNSLTAGNYISGSNFDGSSNITWNINASSNNIPNEIVVRDSSSHIYTSGIGIGTTSTSVPLHVIGNSYLYGTITTNNNNINAGTGTITASVFDGTASNVSNLLSPGDYLLGADYDGSSNITWGVNATSDNTVNTIVSRDSNGDFSAGTITATLFDGTASNVSNYLSPGNYLLGADYDGSSNIIWNINAEETNLGSTIVARDTSANIFVSGIGIGTATVSSPLSVIGSSVLVGNVGIGTTNISHSLTIHSSESVLTVDNGKIGINKLNAITPSTDIEIRNSSDTNYTGILLTNNGNAKHGSSIQIKGVHYDNSSNIAYSANLGLSRQNANALLGANIPLGLIHFGGNHTVPGTNTDSNLYTSYIGAISEESFTTSSNMPTSIILKSGTSGYNYYDTSLQHTNSNIAVLHSSGNFGIGVNSPSYKLDVDGDINFNGILYQNGSAFVSSEWTCNLDGSLYYIDNVGIGTDAPTEKLHVEGNIYSSGTITASNLTVLGDYVTLNTITSNTEQVVVTNDGSGPALQVTQTGEQPIADFYDDGQVLVLRIADGGYIGIGTDNPTKTLDVNGDINFTGTFYQNGSEFVSSEWTCNLDGSVYYIDNVGIGTDAPTEKLHVEGNIYSSGTITATTFSGTLDGTASNVEHTLSPGDYVLGADYDGSSNITWNINATSDNTVSTIVSRDASGNFSAGTITATTFSGTLDGTASNVEHTLSPGDYVLGADYDGSSNITWNINATSDNTVSTVVARDASGNFSAGTITATTFSGTLDGTASNVEHTLSPGDYVLGADYDGSSNITWNINATTDNTVSTLVARDASGNFSAGTITATLDGTASNVEHTLSPGDYVLGADYDGSSNITWNINATSDNTVSTVVARDASGNFSAGTITATLDGTASNVEHTLSPGDYVLGADYDGSSNITWNINATSDNTVSTVVARDASGNFSAGTITANLSGNASTADQVNNILTIGSYLTGDNFNGSTASTIAVDGTTTPDANKVVVRDASSNIFVGGVGIGTTSLSTYELDVNGDINFTGILYQNGSEFVSSEWTCNLDGSLYYIDNVGIGTTNPTEKLHVEGNIYSSGTITASNLTIIGDYVTLNTITSNTEQIVVINDGTGPALKVTQTGSQPIADFYDDGQVLALRIADGGYIGIGTTNPTEKLHVEGNIYSSGTITATTFSGTLDGTASNVEHTLSPGDYVLGADYDGSSNITWNINATSDNTVSTVVARDASGNFSAGTITATLDGTASNVEHTLSPGDYVLGADYDGSSNITWNINATSDNTVSTVVARDASGNFSAGTITATLDGTASNVEHTLSPGDYVLGADYDGSSNITWNINATSDNTVSTVVARDASGNFSAGTITATLDGTASNVEHTLSPGDYVLGADYDGSSNITWNINATSDNTISTLVARDASGNFSAGTITATLNGTASNVEHTLSPGDYLLGADYDGSSNITWNINATSDNTVSTVVSRDASGNFSAGTITANLSGNASTANQVNNILTIGSYLTGDNFNGSTASTIAVDGTTTPDANKVVVRDASSNIFVGGVGIGTTSLSTYELDVNGDINFTGILYQNGSEFVSSEWTCNLDGSLYYIDNVGIGTTNPTEKLHVEGNIYSSGTITASNLTIIGDYVTLNTITSNTEQIVVINDGTGPALKVTQTGSQPIADFYDDGQVLALRIADGGYIGIGTTNPTEKLHVEGNIYSSGTITATTFSGTLDGTASNVEHTLSPGDYVLGADYDGSSNITWNINATSDNNVSTVVARDASGNFSAGTITATTFSGTLDGTASNVEHTLSPGDYVLGADYDGSSNITWNINATSDNTVSTVVARDVSGNFSAGTITATTFSGTLDGTASNVEHTLSPGDYVLGADYDGSSNITWNINATSDNTVSTVVARDVSGNFSAGTITATLDGTASNVEHTLSPGDYVLGADYDGSSNITWNINATSDNTVSTVVARDVSGNFSAGTITATLDGTASNVEHTLSPGDYLLGADYDGSSNITWNINATSDNTVSTVVSRDASGNFSAGTITATLDGTASNVEHTLSPGDYLLGADYDGSSNITWNINATSDNNVSTVVARDASGNFSAGTITATLDGTASNVEHTLSPGDYLLGANYDGSSNITWNINAISDNTVSTIVARDGNGDFAARNITANLSGHATSATSADQVTSTLTRGTYLTGTDFNGSSPTTWAVDGTTTPDANKVVVRDASSNIFAGGVGIGTNSLSTYELYVVGDINFTGKLYKEGIEFISGDGQTTVWSSNNDNTIYYLASNVGIGTDTPIEKLHVEGNIYSSGTITATTFSGTLDGTASNVEHTLSPGDYVLGDDYDGSSNITWNINATSDNTVSTVVARDGNGDFAARNITANLSGHATSATSADQVTSTLTRGTYLTGSDFNGSSPTTWDVDGTTTPDANKVVVRDASSNIFAGGVGIGTNSLSTYELDVAGDINFTGTLYQNGTEFVSSVWTSNNDSTIYYLASNVGIGTTEPTEKLHVYGGDSKFEKDGNNTVSILGNYNGSSSGSTLIVGGNSNINNSYGQIFIGPNKTSDCIVDAVGTGYHLIVRVNNSSYDYISWNNYVNNNDIGYSGNIGIGLTFPNLPNYTLDVAGDINFTGTLYQNGTEFVSSGGGSSVWTSNNDSTIYYLASNVGIGTTNPTEKLHVEGNIYSSGTITATTFSGTLDGTASNVEYTLYPGDYLLGADYDGSSNITWNVDGTITPDANKVVVRDASSNIFVGGVGIGTNSLSTYELDVFGDINFTGTLYQNGSEFVSSEWTCNLDGSLYYIDNVGIGTTNPTEKLHVEGNIYSSGTITASNLTIIGDYVTLNTITSNTEQIVVINDGTGPALKVTQTGSQPIADFYDDGQVLALRIADGGYIGIGTTNPTEKLHVEGNIYSSGTITATTFSGTLDGTASNVEHTLSPGDYVLGADYDGSSNITWNIDGTTTPDANKVVVRDASANIFVGGVGIGTNSLSTYELDVVGDINFTGTLYQNGTEFISSVWTSNNDSTIYYLASNVGIGTDAPTEKLHVYGGDSKFEKDGLNRVSILGNYSGSTSGSLLYVCGTSNINNSYGQILIGPTTADGIVIIASGSGYSAIARFNNGSPDYLMWNNYVNNNDFGYGGNIGIGLTFPNLPNYTLDVAGDINFTGKLYHNGTEFVSSNIDITANSIDITSNATVGGSLDVTGITILSGNVGIGTTNPTEKLHVEGNIKNTGDIISPSLVGQVSYFATTTPPVGWLKCNGASLNRTTYSALFNVIGTTFGSDDANTFKVPDLRGEFIRSWVDDGVIDSGRTFGSSQKGSINAIDQGDNAVLGLSHTSTSATTTLSDYGYDVYWDPTTNMKVKWNNTISGTATIRQATADSGGASRPINTALLACIKY